MGKWIDATTWTPDMKQTNADRIRHMTDEELAELLFDPCIHIWSDPQFKNIQTDFCEITPCRECLLKWLKQET